MTQNIIDCYSKTELIREGKCTCLTCKHIVQMKKLLPNDKLRNKVLEVTDDLFESMAGDIIDLGLQLSDSRFENELLEKNLQCPKCKNIRYMDFKKVEEVIVNYKDFLLTFMGFKVGMKDKGGKIFWEEYRKAISAILKLAIPEDKKNKKLQDEIDRLKKLSSAFEEDRDNFEKEVNDLRNGEIICKAQIEFFVHEYNEYQLEENKKEKLIDDIDVEGFFDSLDPA